MKAWSLLLACWLAMPATAFAVDPFLDWKTLSSDNFHVHYADGHQAYAERALRIAESAHERLSAALNWQPHERTHLVLSDETDFANGFATVVNINRSVLFMAPPTGVGGIEDYDDWLNLLITHEYVHVLHLDKNEGAPEALRSVFGRMLLSFPNLFEPSWIIEGIATWYETDRERNIGRGQSSLFDSMMRAEVANGIKPLRQVNLPVATWPAGATRYLYGVFFFEFMEQRYGSDKIQELVEAYSINLVPFSLNSTFQRVFGKDLSAMWLEFEEWLQQRYRAELDALNQAGVVQGAAVSDDAYQTNLVRVHDGAVYYVSAPGDAEETLVKLVDGDRQDLVEVTSAGFDIRANGDIIINQLEVCDEFSIYYDLYLYRAGSGDTERLTECGRYMRAVWSADGEHIFAIRHEAGNFELHMLDADGSYVRTVYSFAEGNVAGWLDASPVNGDMVMALWRDDYGWNLYRLADSGELQQLTQDNHIQSYPEYAADGSSVYYSADYDGTFNIYRMDLSSGRHRRITRTQFGAMQSSIDKDSLFYTGYTAEGTMIHKLENITPLDSIDVVEGDRIIPYDHPPVEYSESEYSAWPAVKPAWWFPSLVLTEDVTEIGFDTAGNDALGLHNYFAQLSWDADNEVPAASFVYSWSSLFSAAYQRDNTLFKTAAGDKDRIRSSDEIRLVYAIPDSGLRASSQWLLSLGRETSFDNKRFNNAVPVQDFTDAQLALAWLYDNTGLYPLSISRNNGRSIRLLAEDGELLDGDFEGQVYTASWQEFIGLGGEHVLALRGLLGRGEGTTVGFQLGGEDTGTSYNLFFQQSGAGLFNRRDYALRGYEDGLPQLRGQNIQLYSLEWRFPGQRIERGWMAPPAGIMQWSGALFAETGSAWTTGSADTFYSSIGAELTADLNLFYFVPVRARLGLAEGLDDNIGDTRVYLSIGSSF